MAYCEICDSNRCDGVHLFGYECCEWCGEEGVYCEGLCKPCFFSDKSRFEETVSAERHCKNCGRNYPRAGFHRC